MIVGLKQRWRLLRQGRPGRRFQERYERSPASHPAKKWLLIGLGVALMAAGVVLLPAPGPGILVIALGGAIAAEESLSLARLLDWTEVQARRVISSAARFFRRFRRPPAP